MDTTSNEDPEPIRWSEFLNRDPTPPSDFWPPLVVAAPTPKAADSETNDRQRHRETYVLPAEPQTESKSVGDKRESLESLEGFIEGEGGIGMNAIRSGKRGSRWSAQFAGLSSLNSEMALPPRIIEDTVDSGGNQEGEPVDSRSDEIQEEDLVDVSSDEILEVEPVSEQCSAPKTDESETEIVPASPAKHIFNQESEKEDVKYEDTVTNDKSARHNRKARYAKPFIAIQKKVKKLIKKAKRAVASTRCGVVSYTGT